MVQTESSRSSVRSEVTGSQSPNAKLGNGSTPLLKEERRRLPFLDS